jgi:hypothetical protein
VTELSPDGVEHLKSMKRLHTLEFVDVPYYEDPSDTEVPDFIISVAGEVPNLRNFAFTYGNDKKIHNQFIEKFGDDYPQKQLLVNNLT